MPAYQQQQEGTSTRGRLVRIDMVDEPQREVQEHYTNVPGAVSRQEQRSNYSGLDSVTTMQRGSIELKNYGSQERKNLLSSS